MRHIGALLRVMALLVGALVVGLAGCSASEQTTIVSPGASVAAQEGITGLPTVALVSLPPEAQQTHGLILDGGPYPYRQDGQVFGNREGLLPDEEYGWYREYTIETPGSDDRGARRFVVGEDEIFFYTDDHYDSFREVVE